MRDLDDLATDVPWFLAQPLSSAQRRRLVELPARLRERIIAQDDAIEATVRPVMRNVAGVNDAKRPVASVLYVGPTGVGKTDLALALADELYGHEDALFRIDMAEYAEKHTVSRLFGAPPGYMGFDEGGQLTNRLLLNPYSIVLLDEIEKAHPSIFDPLLQLLDAGRLTDGQGRVVDCTKSIVVLTSNAGSREILDHRDDPAAMARAAQHALRGLFRPEFLNRLDAQVLFRPLTPEALARIVERHLRQALDRLQGKGIVARATAAVHAALSRDGYDPLNGVRPLKRAIVRHILDPIADGIVRGDYGAGDLLIVDHDGTSYTIHTQSKGPTRAPSIEELPHQLHASPHDIQGIAGEAVYGDRPLGLTDPQSAVEQEHQREQLREQRKESRRIRKLCVAALQNAARAHGKQPDEPPPVATLLLDAWKTRAPLCTPEARSPLEAHLLEGWKTRPPHSVTDPAPDLTAVRASLLAQARHARQHRATVSEGTPSPLLEVGEQESASFERPAAETDGHAR